MGVTKELIRIDGRPTDHFIVDGHALYVGPYIGGEAVTVDGTVYNLDPHVIEIDPDHAGQLAHLIGVRLEDEGHPAHRPTALDPHPFPFLHVCTEAHCGEHMRDITDPNQAAALAWAQRLTDAIPDGEVRDHFAALHGTGTDLRAARASATAENAALNGLDGTGTTNVIPDVSLHIGDPGQNGANENANAGSYARQACSWNAAASGSKTNSGALTFTTAGSTAVTHFGTWSSATYGAGNYAIGGALASSVTAVTITVASGALTLSAS